MLVFSNYAKIMLAQSIKVYAGPAIGLGSLSKVRTFPF